MPKWSNNKILDAALDIISTSDELVVCSTQPASFFEVVNPGAWAASAVYALDDCARPMVSRNGFTYRCTQAGTSGENEPVWPVISGESVADGSIIWQAVSCLAIANTSIVSADFAKADAASGRKITVVQKTGFVAHSSGTAAHVSLVNKTDKMLMWVDTCPEQVITSGNPVNTGQLSINIRLA